MALQLRSRRLLILLVVGVGVVLLAVGYISLFLARPVGEGPAGPSVPQTSFEQIWTERPVLILGLGDSITAGLGAKSPAHSYFQRMIENPPDEFPEMQGICLASVLPNLTWKNLARSGSTSLHHEEIIQELEAVDDDRFGLVFFTTGGNDIIHNYGRSPPREGAMYGASLAEAEPWIAAFDIRLNEMLDNIDLMFPAGCEIYLADIYDPTDGVGDAPSVFLPDWPDGLAIHSAYNRILRQAANARENVFHVPLYQSFLGHGSHCRQFWRGTYDANDPYYWYYTNIEDPNNRGYDALRRVFLLEILEHSQLVSERS